MVAGTAAEAGLKALGNRATKKHVVRGSVLPGGAQ
jgi:hypothetical protein